MIDIPRAKSQGARMRAGALTVLARLRRAAWAFTTRRIRGGVSDVILKTTTPQAGDLVLAQIDAIGHHSGLQLPEGRRKQLFIGDEIVVAYGNRYAPNQFEAVVPKTLGPCQLVAAGGIAGKALSWHAAISKAATQITPLGLLTGPTGKTMNLRDHALPTVDHVPARCPPTIAVVGTAMDSGKTQTAAHLVKGLSRAGLRVAFAKVTGTGSGGDTWLLKDAGAHPVLDFTDAGLASTYLESPAEIERVFVTLVAHLTSSRPEAIVLEVADGVLQDETAALLETQVFGGVVSGVIFASGDAMGAVAGDAWLRDRNLPLIGLGGVLTSSPLQRRESSKMTGLPVYSRQDLAQATTAMTILALADRRRSERTTGRPNGTFETVPGNSSEVPLSSVLEATP